MFGQVAHDVGVGWAVADSMSCVLCAWVCVNLWPTQCHALWFTQCAMDYSIYYVLCGMYVMSYVHGLTRSAVGVFVHMHRRHEQLNTACLKWGGHRTPCMNHLAQQCTRYMHGTMMANGMCPSRMYNWQQGPRHHCKGSTYDGSSSGGCYAANYTGFTHTEQTTCLCTPRV